MQGKVTLEDHFAIEATLGDSQPFGPHVWPELRHRLLDFQDQRLRLMDEAGVEIMIASLNAPAIQGMPDPGRAAEVARLANDVLAGEIAKRPDRFVGVAALLFTVSGIGAWLAIYHERYSDMSITEATFFTAVALGFGGLVGTFAGGAASDHYHERLAGGRIVLVVWSAIACAVLFMVSFAVDFIPLRLALQIIGVAAAAGAAPGLRAAMTDVVPPESRGVGASAMALATSVFGLALAPFLVGLLSDLTGSLVTAFYIVFPPVIVGLLFLLRARHTLADDAQAIVTAIVEENQLLEQQRLAAQHDTPDPNSSPERDGNDAAPDDTPDPNLST